MGMLFFPIIVMPLAIAAVFGAGLLARGMRGAPVFSEPRCAKCKYDLRGSFPNAPTNCPECGASLATPNAVSWGKNVRQPRLIRIGAAMLGLPLLILAAMLFGTLRSGTYVVVGKKIGSYTLVHTADGIAGYVKTSDIATVPQR